MQILKEQGALRVWYQSLKGMCWTKPPERFLWTITSPRAAGFVCWFLIVEPPSLSFQARLPVCNWGNQELLLPEPSFSAPGLNKLKSVFYQSKETFQEFQPASQMCRVGSMIWAAPVVNTASECCTGEGKPRVTWKKKLEILLFFCFFFFPPLTVKIKHWGLGLMQSMGLFAISNFVKAPETTGYLIF